MKHSNRWAVTLVAGLAGPALAETPDEALARQCPLIWDQIVAVSAGAPLSGTFAGVQDGWCLFTDVDLQSPGYTPDLTIQELRYRGAAAGHFLLGERAASGMDFDLRATGLRMVPQVGQPQSDYLFRAQSQIWGIDADLSMTWDAPSKVLSLTGLTVDFPGQNTLFASFKASNVDLSSMSAIEMSATGFAITEASLDVTSLGLFETYALLPLGVLLLPYEGDMEAEVDALRSAALGVIAQLPEASVPPASKDALARLLAELPNPAGRLTARFTADPGFGPARLMGYAMTGIPTTMEEAAPLFNGTVLDVTWTHQDMPE